MRRLSVTLCACIGAMLATTMPANAALPKLTINPNGQINADGSARVTVTVSGGGANDILVTGAWLVDISVDGNALPVGNQGINDSPDHKTGTVTINKNDFTPQKGKTYTIKITVKLKSGAKPTDTKDVTFP